MRKLEVQLAGLRVDIISTQDEKEACVAAEDFGGAEKAKEKLAQLEAEQQRITAAMQPKEVGARGWNETQTQPLSYHSSPQPPLLKMNLIPSLLSFLTSITCFDSTTCVQRSPGRRRRRRGA